MNIYILKLNIVSNTTYKIWAIHVSQATQAIYIINVYRHIRMMYTKGTTKVSPQNRMPRRPTTSIIVAQVSGYRVVFIPLSPATSTQSMRS
jgi:hypothetical protein